MIAYILSYQFHILIFLYFVFKLCAVFNLSFFPLSTQKKNNNI